VTQQDLSVAEGQKGQNGTPPSQLQAITAQNAQLQQQVMKSHEDVRVLQGQHQSLLNANQQWATWGTDMTNTVGSLKEKVESLASGAGGGDGADPYGMPDPMADIREQVQRVDNFVTAQQTEQATHAGLREAQTRADARILGALNRSGGLVSREDIDWAFMGTFNLQTVVGIEQAADEAGNRIITAMAAKAGAVSQADNAQAAAGEQAAEALRRKRQLEAQKLRGGGATDVQLDSGGGTAAQNALEQYHELVQSGQYTKAAEFRAANIDYKLRRGQAVV
jgi:hypothetical protein